LSKRESVESEPREDQLRQQLVPHAPLHGIEGAETIKPIRLKHDVTLFLFDKISPRFFLHLIENF
jgi:hypothetical protein